MLLPLGQYVSSSASPGPPPHRVWLRRSGVAQEFAYPTSFQVLLPVACRPHCFSPGPCSPLGIFWKRMTSLALLQPPSALIGHAGGEKPKPQLPWKMPACSLWEAGEQGSAFKKPLTFWADGKNAELRSPPQRFRFSLGVDHKNIHVK